MWGGENRENLGVFGHEEVVGHQNCHWCVFRLVLGSCGVTPIHTFWTFSHLIFTISKLMDLL